MVNWLNNNNRLLIHQALHGYSDGHRLISASIQLSASDAQSVLILSDSSGGTGRSDNSGYLTGYPLRESGLFALARTWQAPEMSRPGCVWTHTLFVDFSDLANLPSLDSLITLFRRPSQPLSIVQYGKPFLIERVVETKMVEIALKESAWCRQLLTALYEYPMEKIISVSPTFDPEPLLLAIWSQQWPRLRRSFCFCTSTVTDRSNNQLRFDLQILPVSDRGIMGRFPRAISIEEQEPVSAPWMDDAIADLFKSRDSSLRSFLRRVGSEISTGRAAFAELVSFHRLLSDAETKPEAIDSALSMSFAFFPDPSNVGQLMLANKAVRHAGHLSTVAHDFLLQHLPQLDRETLLAYAETIGEATWVTNPQRFCELLEGNENEVIVGSRTLAALSSEQLIVGLSKCSDFIARILARRPELTAVPLFWEVSAVDDPAFEFLRNNQDLRSQAIVAMLKCGASRLARKAFSAFGNRGVWEELAPAIDHTLAEQRDLRLWIKTSLNDPCGVAEALVEGRFHTKKPLAMIARLSEPDVIPNDFGLDPWVLAMNSAKGSLPPADNIYLMCYLLARALGSRSRNSADLAALAFEDVYLAATKDSFQSDEWGLLDYRLPVKGFWDKGGRSERIRNAVAKLFVERNLSPRIFVNLTKYDPLFAELAQAAMRVWGGRNYLRQLREVLQAGDSSRSEARIHAVDFVLD